VTGGYEEWRFLKGPKKENKGNETSSAKCREKGF
jgi:hypothetical protein